MKVSDSQKALEEMKAAGVSTRSWKMTGCVFVLERTEPVSALPRNVPTGDACDSVAHRCLRGKANAESDVRVRLARALLSAKCRRGEA